MEHMQSALDRFTAAWQSLSATTLDSGFLTDIINFGTDFIEILDGIIDKTGVLIPLLMGIFGTSGLFGKGAFKATDKGISFLGSNLGELLTAFKQGTGSKSSFFGGLDAAWSKFNGSQFTRFDIKAIKNYNNLISQGVTDSARLNAALAGTSDAVAQARIAANGGAIALNGMGKAANTTKTAMLGMRAASLALNVGLGLLISAGINLAITAFDTLVNAEENASEAADNAFSDASATATQAAESYSNLTDLVAQYKDIASQDTSDPTVRMQLVDVQSQINELVGEEASSIDLVNGSLNEQLGLLNQIQVKQAEKTSEAAKAAYYAAKDAEDAAYGQKDQFFQNYDVVAENNPDIAKLLNDMFPDAVTGGFDLFKGTTLNIDVSYLDTAEQKLEALRGMMDAIESKYDDFASMDIYKQLNSAYEYYEKYADDTAAAARTFLEQQTQTEMVSSNFASILDANAQQFEQARNNLIESLMSNETISDSIDSGKLNTDDIVQYVNTYMSTLDNFSSGYNDWVNEIHSLDDVLATSGLYGLDGTGIDMSEAQDIDSYIQKISQLKDAYSDFNNGELDTSDIERLKEQFPELNSIMEESGISADNFDDAIATLLDSMQTDMIDSFNSSVGDVSQMSDEAASRVTILSNALNSLSLSSQAMSFTIDISAETETINNLNDALAASKTATGLTAEQMVNVEKAFQNLEGYDHAKMFEETANGIRLNTQEFNRLSTALTNGKIEEADANLKIMKDDLDELDDKIRQARETGDLTNIDTWVAEREQIRAQINDTAELAAQYKGLASAYKQWQDTESAGNDRDMYESIGSAFEGIQDEINRGWWDDGTREYLELMTGRDLSTANIDEMRDAYAQLDKQIGQTGYSIRDFFTQTEDGTFDTNGIYNFLEAAESFEQQLGYDFVKRNESGEIAGFEFSVDGKKALADAMGISEELIDIIARASEDAGFVVNMDGTYTQLADLKANAEQAAIDLKDTFKKTTMDFSFDTSDTEQFASELAEAKRIWESYRNEDGSINFELDGAQEAVDLYSTLVAMADQLSEPVYMNIDASQVDEELQEPISKMQEYERLTEQRHQIEINGGDVTEVANSMENIVDYLDGLDEEVKVQLGIDGMSKEEIEKSLEDGSIEPEIDGTVNLDVEMSNDLKDIRALLMHQAGLLSDEELTLIVDYDVDSSEVDNYTPEQKQAAVDFFSDTTDIDKYTPEQKQAIVKYIKDIDDIQNWTPEQKTAVCDFIVNNEDVMEYTPEEKAVVARYIADTSQLDTATPEEREILARFIADHGEVDAWQPEDREAIAKFLLDNAEVEGYEPTDKDAEVIFGVDSSKVDRWQAPDKTADAIYTAKLRNTALPTLYGTAVYTVSGGGSSKKNTVGMAVRVDGTAHANGTVGSKAFARGNWGTEDDGTALVGELGQELVVRDGHFFTIGDNGAEFFNYKKNDIIFNHRQTEELLKNGYVTSNGGRGRAYAQGTAFITGSGGAGRPNSGGTAVGSPIINNNVTNNYNYNTSKSTSSSSKKSSSSSKKEAEEFSETLDWIEVLIDRIERSLGTLDTIASSAFRSWSERTNALNEAMAVTRQEIDLQNQAYQRYMQEANSVGLSADWVNKIQNGLIDIETIGDEALSEQISKYKEYYEAALDARDAVVELEESLSELAQQKFDNIETQFEGAINSLQFEQDRIDIFVTREELDGHLVSSKYYEALMENVHQQANQLRAQREEMIKQRDEMVNAGQMQVGDEAWDAINKEINDVTISIGNLGNKWAEFRNSIRETEWEVFDLLQDRIQNVADEAQFLIDLMSNEKLFEDNGQLTDKGKATMGLYAQQYNVYMNQADRYAAELETLKAQMENDPADLDLADRYYELVEAQQEAILSAEQMKDAMKDMVEEGIELELDALDDLIDKYLDALQAQKDLYDYENEIREKTDDIAMLEKQLSAYAGDDSEESKATIQELTEQLTDAQRDLADAEYERQISDVERLLDQMRLDYETILNARLDNIDALIMDMIAESNANAGLISDVITSEANNVGYTLSEEMQSIWSGANNVLSYYGDNFLNNGTTIANTLNNINTGIQNMIASLDKFAQEQLQLAKDENAYNKPVTKPTTPSGGNNNNNNNTQQQQPEKQITVGGKINAGSATIYATSQGTGGGRQYYANDPIYTVLKEQNGYLLVRYHKLSSGYTGWFRKSDVKAYATGKRLIDNDELAWTQENGAEMIVRPSDGAILTPLAKNDSVLNAAATQNIWDMANNPAEFIKDNLGIGGTATSPAATGGTTNIVQNLDNITFNLPNIRNYEQLLASMQKDRNFERLINSMTLDKIAGKNSLGKSKALR